MALPPRGLIVSLLGTSLLLTPASFASAQGAGAFSGGVLAEPGTTTQRPAKAGGAEYGSRLRRLPGRPRVRVLKLASPRVRTGARPNLLIDVRRRAARTARVRVVISARGRPARSLGVRRVRAGRTTRVRLPRLRAGSYRVRVTVLAGAGERALAPRTLRLTVRRKPRPAKRHAPAARPAPAPVIAPTAPVTQGSGVFPVQGSYSFGGRDSVFGAGRRGHTHEGQDISAAEGVPVVAPLAGEVLFNDYQAGGAGRYVVLQADTGWHMFFAHLRAGSATLDPGARVAAGQQIGAVGSTGGSSGPHLHFEIWPDGWRHLKGTQPIDPLPQLRAWAGL